MLIDIMIHSSYDSIFRFKSIVNKLKDDLVELGYCSFTVEDFRDVVSIFVFDN